MIETLADWAKHYPTWTFHCDACRPPRAVRLSPDLEIKKHGGKTLMADYRARASCRVCGSRGWPDVRVICSADGRPR